MVKCVGKVVTKRRLRVLLEAAGSDRRRRHAAATAAPPLTHVPVSRLQRGLHIADGSSSTLSQILQSRKSGGSRVKSGSNEQSSQKGPFAYLAACVITYLDEGHLVTGGRRQPPQLLQAVHTPRLPKGLQEGRHGAERKLG